MENKTNGATAPATQENKMEVAVQPPSQSERFTKAIEREFSSNAGAVTLTSFQKKLCQNYFIRIDMMLKEMERKRLAKVEKYRDPLPCTWENVNMRKLAVDVIAFASLGLDPAQSNHINPIAFKGASGSRFDITFIIGYKGLELKAKKYGYDVPDDVVVELVYKNDNFKQIKKDVNNKVENYIFEIMDDFNRGEVVGGFYYYSYNDKPSKNKIRVFTMKDIEKRKPEHAAPEFWGGDKDKWEWQNGQRVKTGTEKVDGWFEEMCLKTIQRAAYNNITIDSEKIDENYLAVIQKEKESRDFLLQQDIKENSNREEIGFTETTTEVDQYAETVDDVKEEENGTTPAPVQQVNNITHPVKEPAKQATNGVAQTISGPGF